MKNKDRFRGCFIGGAAGDALGYEVEFMREKEIFKRFGEEGITEYALHKGMAEISDDTQMTLFTAAAFLFDSEEEFPLEYIKLCYKDWYRTQSEGFPVRDRQTHSFLLHHEELYSRRAPGNTCLDAIRSGACGTIENPVNDSKGCGGIMRVAPVGLYYTDKDTDPDKVALYAAQAAAVTHGHDLGYIPSAALAHIVHSLSRGGISVPDAVKKSVESVNRVFSGCHHIKDFNKLINNALEYAMTDKDDLKVLRKLGEGWVAEETLAVAVYCAVKYQNDFDKALRVSVNHNGDSDSTGAVTGNILGTYTGYEAIPEKYKKNLELHDLLIQVSDDLFERC